MHNSQVELSLQEFKSRYSFQVFTNYIGKTPPIGKGMLSPLRDEKNPSFSVFKDEKTAEYLFKDHGSGESGDCIKFVQLKFNIDFKAAIDLLQQDFNCSIGDNLLSQPAIKNTPSQNPLNQITVIKSYELKERASFNQQEAEYYNQYNIKAQVLKDYNVIALDGYVLPNGMVINRRNDELIFCYRHEGWAKIYKPNESNRKFKFQHLGNKPHDFIFGYDLLAGAGDLLIITGGEKDVLTLASLGFNAISLNSETAGLSIVKAEELKARFKEIIVLYDTDETGLKSSEKLCKAFGFKQAILPNDIYFNGEKDISDFIRSGFSNDQLDNVLQNSITFELPIIQNLLIVQSANAWIDESKNNPIPEMLFDVFWFEGELCILFSDTNMGKSILAVQIADSISKGINIDGFKLEAEKQNVLYLDFELSAKQFEARYSIDYMNHYHFSESFYRAEINPDSVLPSGFSDFESYLNHSLEQQIIDTGCRIIIIDNLTYLRSETEKAREALPLMKYLKSLKKKYSLSILALAHTPKRDLSKPITRNDLQGSKMLINFCDSSFAIGESQQDKSYRYFKQIKARNTDVIFDKDNICLCIIEKPENFLQFRFLEYCREREHLKTMSEKDQSDLETNIKELNNSQPNLSLQEIADQLGTYKQKVYRILKKSTPS
jgi:5S rRNA maturation endonuclease (ribonuclease M5)/RecA-family ATPase